MFFWYSWSTLLWYRCYYPHRSRDALSPVCGIFVLKSVIAKQRFQGKAILIQPSDIKKYFDKEMILDIILACEKRGADPKARRLWYKLNQDTQIRVRTGVGMSDYTYVGAVVKG